jgi:tetratricopeptide (TPR) repeat protein
MNGEIVEPAFQQAKLAADAGVADRVLSFATFKNERVLKKTDGAKRARITGMPKLMDANDAGTKHSEACTLILTEGDSAKSFAVAGLAVVGRTHFGVFPLRGKVKNVRDATAAQADQNRELRALKTIIGLRTGIVPEQQAPRYGRVLAADGTHAQALDALDRLYEATGNWNELAAVLARQSQLASSPDSVLEFQFRLGHLYQKHLGRVDLAIAQYQEILAAAPEHAKALGALEELFAGGVQPLVIAEILEPLYRMSESWGRLVGVYQVELEQVSDPAARIAMIHRIAEIAEDRAGEPQVAYEWHLRALLEDPTNERSVPDSERLAGALGTWEPLADALATVLAQRADVEIRVAVGHRLARIYENELGDVQRATETHLFVLGASPTDIEALEALDRIFLDNGAAEPLQEVLWRRVGAASDARDKVELAFRRAQVLENDLGRVDEAVGVYLGILDSLDPEHEASIQALAFGAFTGRSVAARAAAHACAEALVAVNGAPTRSPAASTRSFEVRPSASTRTAAVFGSISIPACARSSRAESGVRPMATNARSAA